MRRKEKVEEGIPRGRRENGDVRFGFGPLIDNGAARIVVATGEWVVDFRRMRQELAPASDAVMQRWLE